ncbi:MAG: methionine gamma-lyase family protein [Candidatus Caenarcaniphilales bacterium]|nr:methionine gamma-lyase family protein [Candidatus Caenarcaniphilales bacterium]
MLDSHILDLIERFEDEISSAFKRFDQISFLNHQRVAEAFSQAQVATEHFQSTTGYGHDDLGREKFDQLFALLFKAEAALARINFVSGTHAIGCALLANLEPGSEVVFAFGKPYDTFEGVLRYTKEKLKGNLVFVEHEHWHDYKVISDIVLKSLTERTKLVFLQRSRGYCAKRPSINILQLKEMIQAIKKYNPAIICLVDNCYGEFVEESEPIEAGADLIAGSLIKNPGGGIVSSGGYVAGKREYVQASADRLTVPGIGGEGGPNFGEGRLLFQGLYLAPRAVNQALKSVTLAARVFEHLGFKTDPHWSNQRTDTILRIDIGSREKLIEICRFLQSQSPIDSHLTPEPAITPGYEDSLIMAAGTFIEGSTSELSADAPLRPPYSLFLQGGLSYYYTKLILIEYLRRYSGA